MKSLENKREFIRLRAENISYGVIAEKLNISKSTCVEWERELKSEISALKREYLSDLYQEYAITREHNTKALGAILKRIETEIENRPLEELSTKDLINLSVRIREQLTKDRINTSAPIKIEHLDDIQSAYSEVCEKALNGDVTEEEARSMVTVLNAELKALLDINQEKNKEAQYLSNKGLCEAGYISAFNNREDIDKAIPLNFEI